MKKAISACLAGVNCRYNKTSYLNKEYEADKETFLLICPEVSAGLSIPRQPMEIVGKIKTNAYDDLVKQQIKVINKDGQDYSQAFIAGAQIILKQILDNNIKEVILKDNSPSCGVNYIYDGTFSNRKISKPGVLTSLLIKNEIKVRVGDDNL
ncbi:DUF523 domain-containing protein [Erysipelotrichaceae bacterium OttesenSCG-928-M19]|nr:DUF523 domain-containing protein [Erysipelotrichaceae bacterium OttesenSCG-928-M19]